MKPEIKEILDYMEGGEEILRLREQVKNLDAQDSAGLQIFTDTLDALMTQAAEEDQKYAGCYDVFMGCVWHVRGDFGKATTQLKQALRELKGSKNNKAVAHWLLSVNYSSSKEFDKARKELIKAERLSKVRINAMQVKVDTKIKDMFNDPIFALVPPDPKPRVAGSGNVVVDAVLQEQPSEKDQVQN